MINLDKTKIENEFINLFFSKKLDVKLAKSIKGIWNDILVQLNYVPVAYTAASLSYQEAYMKCFVEELLDLSVVFFQNGKPIGIWPLSLKLQSGIWEFVTNEGAILAPLFINEVQDRSRKKICEVAIQSMENIYRKIAIVKSRMINQTWRAQHLFMESHANSWYRKCLEKDAKTKLSHELYVDLSWDYEDIRKNVRKSFKALIHLGERLWCIKVHEDISDEEFAEYQQLHYTVSGRITRSNESWALQKDAIRNKQAFLVTLRDEADSLVGGGLFNVSRDEGVYAVGVYDRSLFDKPLGHAVQMAAIRHMKECGLKWYRIGTRFYHGEDQDPTDKEYSISYFKEGFATHMFLNVITECKFYDKKAMSDNKSSDS